MPNSYQPNGGDVLTLPTQKLLLSLSLDDLARFVRSLDMEELIELLHFYEFKERFEACIIVRNHMKDERKRMQEKGSMLVYS